MKSILNSKITSLVLITLLPVFGFANLQSAPIQFWDEATNVSVILETVYGVDQDTLEQIAGAKEKTISSPRAEMAGPWDLKYTGNYFWEKPPIYYWIGILLLRSETVPPENILLAMRAVSVTAGIAMILVAAIYLGSRNKKNFWLRFNLVVALFLGSGFFWLTNSAGWFSTHTLRSADSDSLQLLFIVSGLILVDYYYRLYKQDSTSRLRLIKILVVVLIGAFSGLGLMVKGSWGLIPFLSFLVVEFMLIRRQQRYYTGLIKVVIALATISGVVLPWHIYAFTKFGYEFVEVYFLYHQFSRATAVLEGNNQSVLFYIQLLLDPRITGTLYVLLVSIISTKIYRLSFFPYVSLLNLIALSFLGTKLAWYLFYALPLIIIESAQFISNNINKINKRVILFICGIIIVQITFNFHAIIWRYLDYDDNYNQGNEKLIYTTGELDRINYYKLLLDRQAN